jgi:hypothetical protein
VNDDDGTFCGKEFGDRLTQSGARSGHQCALSRKSQIHVLLYFCVLSVVAAINSSTTSTREPERRLRTDATEAALRLEVVLEPTLDS